MPHINTNHISVRAVHFERPIQLFPWGIPKWRVLYFQIQSVIFPQPPGHMAVVQPGSVYPELLGPGGGQQPGATALDYTAGSYQSGGDGPPLTDRSPARPMASDVASPEDGHT